MVNEPSVFEPLKFYCILIQCFVVILSYRYTWDNTMVNGTDFCCHYENTVNDHLLPILSIMVTSSLNLLLIQL